MKVRQVLKAVAISSLLILCSCSLNPMVEDGAVGGAIGTGIGAGTGALVGSAIANGDIAASAIAGTAIGLPAGIALGVVYSSMKRQNQLDARDDLIKENAEYIRDLQREVDTRREQLYRESSDVVLDPARSEHLYTGQTLGAPLR